MPTSEDRQTTAWVERVLQRTVISPPVTLTLVSPPELGRRDDETIVVPCDAELLIGIASEGGAPGFVTLEVLLPGETVPEKVRLPDPPPAILSFGRVVPGRIDVWISGDADTGLSLLATGWTDPDIRGGGPCLVVSCTDGVRKVAPLYSEQAVDLLIDVRNGFCLLESIRIPGPIEVVIRSGDDGEANLHGKTVIKPEDGETQTEFEERLRNVLRELLLRPNQFLQIEVGNYGVLALPSYSRSIKRVVLSDKARRLMSWLSSIPPSVAACAPSGFELRRKVRALDQSSVDYGDWRLLQRIVGRASWPVWVEPHIRVLLSQLSRS